MAAALKRIISILLIVALVFQHSVRVGIFGHYLVNIDYISEVLCVNKNKPELCCRGKCQLKLKLDKQNQTEQKLPSAIKELSEVLFFCSPAIIATAVNERSTIVQLPPYKFGVTAPPVFRVFHPPASC